MALPSEKLKVTPEHLADLQKSGLTPEHARQLHIESIGSNSYRIPYFDSAGKVSDFFREKHFYTQEQIAKAKKAKKKVPRKYTQPADTEPHIYLPPLLDVKWRKVLNDPSIPKCITEGEKKAACGCANGIPTIGLGGTWNWRSRRRGLQFLSELNSMPWRGCKVRVVGDSDLATNDRARRGAEWFVAELKRRGAEAVLVILPPDGDTKVGLDDYIVKHGAVATMELLANPVNSTVEPYMEELNQKIAVITDTGEFLDLNTGKVYGNTALRNVFSKIGDLSAWIKWAEHKEVRRLVFQPGEPNGITSAGDYNTWPGWAVEPLKCKAKDVQPWKNLVARVLPKATSEQQRWVECWVGYPIKYPGTKLNTALLVWSHEQGTGKNALGATMKYIYGRAWGKVDGSELAGSFNEWALNKHFIVADELKIGDRRGLTNRLKDMITRSVIRINSKNQKTYEVDDRINYFLTSNHSDAMYVEDRDRRMAIFHASEERMFVKDWREYELWLKDGGAGMLMYYFQNLLDYSAFDPLEAAPVTADKLAMIESGRSDAESWIADLKRDPGSVLATPYDLYRSVDLHKAYDPAGRERIKPNGFATKLGEAGMPRISHNHSVIQGARAWLWVVRGDVTVYQRMTPKQLADAYEAERDAAGERGVGVTGKFKRIVQ